MSSPVFLSFKSSRNGLLLDFTNISPSKSSTNFANRLFYTIKGGEEVEGEEAKRIEIFCLQKKKSRKIERIFQILSMEWAMN